MRQMSECSGIGRGDGFMPGSMGLLVNSGLRVLLLLCFEVPDRPDSLDIHTTPEDAFKTRNVNIELMVGVLSS